MTSTSIPGINWQVEGLHLYALLVKSAAVPGTGALTDSRDLPHYQTACAEALLRASTAAKEYYTLKIVSTILHFLK